MSAALVVSERGSQNRNYLIASACIYRTYARSCAHWETICPFIHL